MITNLELLYIKNLHKNSDDTKTLASKIGINQSMLYDIEAGRRNLTKDIFNKIIKYYNVTYNDRQSIYDEAYKLTLELFSYIISFEKPKMYERYDEMHDRIEMYQHSKAFIFYDLIQAIRNKENNNDIRAQYVLNCKDFIEVYDNNIIFVYSILLCFSKDISEYTSFLENVVLNAYKRYSLVGVNDDMLAMLYYQIGRIYESKYHNFEALNYFDKSITAFQNIHNLQRTIQVKIQKANIYFNLKDYDKAECEYLKLYEESSLHNFKNRMNACADNLSFIYFVKHDYDNCLKYIQYSRDNGSTFPDLNYYKAYIFYKTKDLNTAKKEIKNLLNHDNELNITHVLKLIQAFTNGNDKNVEYYFELSIKDFKNINSMIDTQLIYEMILDYYKDRNPQRVKELLPEYINLIR